MRMIFRTAILIAALTTPACAGTHVSQAEAPRLVLTGVGRFAVLADLASMKLAFGAYRTLRTRAAQPPVTAEGLDEDQQFFVAAAQAWCGVQRRADLEHRLVTTSQIPSKFRLYGALRNLPEFASAFQCAAGTPMNPANTCAVW